MEPYTVVVFGEAQKGEFSTGYFCKTLWELERYLGHPPEDSRGLFFAIQALLFNRSILFFRVKEEGFSQQDYLMGAHLLESQPLQTKNEMPQIAAIGLPGVGDEEIIQVMTPLCFLYHSILLTTESDIFDYVSQLYVCRH